MTEPTKDQSYCDVGDHQHCSGYTEDEFDTETCMCNCHDLIETEPILQLVIDLYNKERRPGWDPSWINAEPGLWRSLEERVRNGERA